MKNIQTYLLENAKLFCSSQLCLPRNTNIGVTPFQETKNINEFLRPLALYQYFSFKKIYSWQYANPFPSHWGSFWHTANPFPSRWGSFWHIANPFPSHWGRFWHLANPFPSHWGRFWQLAQAYNLIFINT